MKIAYIFFAISVALFVLVALYGLLQKKVKPDKDIQQRMDDIRLLNLERTAEERRQRGLGGQGQKGANALDDEKPKTFAERVIQPFMDFLEAKVTSFAPHEILAAVQHRVVLAGWGRKYTGGQILATSVVSFLVMLAFTFFLMKGSDYPMVQLAMIVFVGGCIGGYVPFAIMGINQKKRQESIRRQLPEVLDMLCVSVQAGLSFDGALTKITDRMTGFLIDELKRLQDDVRMGSPRRTAMRAMAGRCDVQEVSLFITALIQAERLGTSMASTLKNQADNIRERRRQYVKAEAMKAPVKILFPLVLFIFPAIFVVVLVPTLLMLMKTM
ncbi:type II secretion system F family protein [uncultured Selenomonas sp.]|uniref:type II secretion system F family protein n=1 Tax=uncultured Selenomonas sp. TaxID=159275 RepID=UPI0025D0ECA2|nr:type II secretion system F family protein [uncultured Selenomonas sp.]